MLTELCTLLTWTAHAPRTCACICARDEAASGRLGVTVRLSVRVCLISLCIVSGILQSTFFASESLSCWQFSACSPSGFESRVTWSTRSSLSSTCLSLSARFTSSYRDTMIRIFPFIDFHHKLVQFFFAPKQFCHKRKRRKPVIHASK